MNAIFLCSLIWLSSSDALNQLAPLKKIINTSLVTTAPLKKMPSRQLIKVVMDHQKDHAYLLSLLSNVNPTQLNDVIVVIQTLLAASESDLADLTLASTNANRAYTDASAAHDAVVLTRLNLITTYNADKSEREIAFTAAKAILDSQVNALFVVQTEAHGAKTNAQVTLDTESIRLDAEIDSLTQVIALLETLGGPTFGSGSILITTSADIEITVITAASAGNVPTLTVNDGAFPGEWAKLAEGVRQFSDRSYKLTKIPTEFIDQEYWYFKGPCHSQVTSLTVNVNGVSDITVLASKSNTDLNRVSLVPAPFKNQDHPQMLTQSFGGTGFVSWTAKAA